MADATLDPPAPPPPWLFHDPLGPPVDPALGGPLLVSPVVGTSIVAAGPTGAVPVVVATDPLLAHAELLARLARTLDGDARSLGGATGLPADALAGAPPSAGRSVGELVTAHTLTRAAGDTAQRASAALRRAIDAYDAAEARQREATQILAAQLAGLLGPVLRDLVAFGLPAVLLAHAAGLPTTGQLHDLQKWMLDHPEVITSPAFVEAVRAGVMGIDDGVASSIGLPPQVTAAIAAAAGFVGVQGGAAYLIAGARPFGLFRDGPVHVTRLSTSAESTGPSGAVQRLARVPEGDQLRIERYDAPGEPPRFMVYVGPTETFSPVATTEPWDLTSNVTGVAGLSSGSLRATEQAMRDAGISPDDRVQFVGFSQGGLVAARLAGSGDWNASGLETYGAPTGNVELPEGLNGLAVRNTDDFVPALAGPQLDHHLVQVERQAFAAGSELPTGLPAPAHQRSAYVATATAVDAAQSDAVRQQIAAMDEFTEEYTSRDGSTVTVMMYHADRGAARANGPSVLPSP